MAKEKNVLNSAVALKLVNSAFFFFENFTILKKNQRNSQKKTKIISKKIIKQLSFDHLIDSQKVKYPIVATFLKDEAEFLDIVLKRTSKIVKNIFLFKNNFVFLTNLFLNDKFAVLRQFNTINIFQNNFNIVSLLKRNLFFNYKLFEKK